MLNLGVGRPVWRWGVGLVLAAGLVGGATAEAVNNKYLVCKKDKDCVFVPSICGRCAPCKPTLREVGNRKKLQRVRMLQQRVRCAKPRCRKCANHKHWRGTEAICHRGRCVVAPPRKKTRRQWPHLMCRRDKDCVFRPSICQRCAPCKLTWRPVCNRKTARSIRAKRARARCRTKRCVPCSGYWNWVGKKAVCVRKQCVAR